MRLVNLKASPYVDNDTPSFYPSISTDVDYIPIGACNTGEIFYTDKNKVLTYYFYSHVPGYSTKTYSRITHFICGDYYSDYNKVALTAFRSLELSYYLENGLVYFIEHGVPIPLLAMCVKKHYLLGNENKINRVNINPRHFSLVIDNKFLSTKHIKFYRMVYKHYIDLMKENKIDIVYVDDLIKSCYNSELPRKNFSTIEEMLNYGTEITKMIIS